MAPADAALSAEEGDGGGGRLRAAVGEGRRSWDFFLYPSSPS